MTQRSRVEEIVHRVNNLLGTIEIQAEVASGLGTREAYADAMALIVGSARRTRADMLRVVGENGSDSVGDGDRATPAS